MLANRMIQAAAAASQANAKLYVDDVFSAYTYTGTGADRSITTGINLVPVADPDWSYVTRQQAVNGTPMDQKTGITYGGNLGGNTADGPFTTGGYSASVSRGTAGATTRIESYGGTTWSAGTVPWCYEGWAKTVSSEGGGASSYVSIIDSYTNTGVDELTVRLLSGSGAGTDYVNLRLYKNSVALADISYNVTQYVWHFISVNYDGSNVRLYVDGVLKHTVAFTGWTTPPPTGASAKVVIQAGSDGAGDTAQAYLGPLRWTAGASRSATRTVVPTRTFPTGSTAGTDGLLWLMGRNGTSNIYLTDTAKTLCNLNTSNTAGYSSEGVGKFTETGFSLGTSAANISTTPYIAWTFKKAPKFFDVVTYMGNATNRTLSHSLGQAPGMIIIKRTDGSSSWMVYHRSLANTKNLVLNTTAAEATNATAWNSTTADASVFSLGTHADVNTSGGTYVAYLFAHDTTTDGLIQCGSYTASANVQITLGWEPQYLLIKRTNAAADWRITDQTRGWGVTSQMLLYPNATYAEGDAGASIVPNATGFKDVNAYTPGDTVVYLAIRRPNKPPTTGTQVYNAIARTGTGAAATVTGVGFAPDLVAAQARSVAYGGGLYSRLCGSTKAVSPYNVNAERTDADSLTSFDMDGFSVGVDAAGWYLNKSPATYINHLFKRAPGMFDVVCYTGTGVAKTEAHGLGVVPELMIVKTRSGSGEAWIVSYANSPDAGTILALNSTNGNMSGNPTIFNSTRPTSSVLSLGTATSVNANAATYIAYLFATKSGISKVGSYTGDGSTGKIINCDFTTTARFILIKRTDAAGDWYIWDTTRGITNGSNDPHLSLNTTAAEVTTDNSIDPHSQGFMVNQVAATNINVNTATYIYLAIS